jgi:hypothetical protein
VECNDFLDAKVKKGERGEGVEPEVKGLVQNYKYINNKNVLYINAKKKRE